MVFGSSLLQLWQLYGFGSYCLHGSHPLVYGVLNKILGESKPLAPIFEVFKISTLLAGLEDLLKKNKAKVVKTGQCKLVLSADQHNLPVEKISKSAIKVIKRLKQAGYKAYLVGGGVRDLLLGKDPKDFDVSTNATPEQVRRLFSNARIIGRRFKIVHIIYNNDDIIEVTTFRGGNAQQLHVEAPVSIDGKRFEVQVNPEGMLVRDNSYGKKLEEDAQRRDFTINAIYFDVQTGELIDFHGGLYDLTQGIIDIIGDPETRYREDPVRMLRAARFSAKLGFKISKRTLEQIEPCSNLLAMVSNARLYDEVNKLFLTGHAQASFKVLYALQLFTRLFCINPGLLNISNCKNFLNYAFASTDDRFRDNKRNMPHFLYAIVLWNAFIWDFFRARNRFMLSNKEPDYNDLLNEITSSVVLQQYQVTAIPEQIIHSITLLWRLQFLLESKEPEKYAHKVTAYASFRAAFDLFKLRAHFDPTLQDKVEYWQPFYDQLKADAERRKQSLREDRKSRRDKRRRDKRERERGARDDRNGSDFKETSADALSRVNKARAWRESMNLEP